MYLWIIDALVSCRRWKEQSLCLKHSCELVKMGGFILSNCSWESSPLSHSVPICTKHVQSLGLKCSLFFFLSVEFGAIVSGTWNQPAYKNQTELHIVVSDINKEYNATAWRFLVLQKLFSFLLLFTLHALSLGKLQAKWRPTHTRELERADLSWIFLNRQPFLFFFFPIFLFSGVMDKKICSKEGNDALW